MSEGSKRPTHRIYIARSYEKDGVEKTHWTEIGAAFANRQGGFNIQLTAAPIDGRCVALPADAPATDQPQKP
ncbi:MAG: hypothetical protein HYS27_03160 [Deltaproteobacteria bacterium]|nr:hypothetical protein [Deltaproteobacteria bacterium]